MDSQELQAWFDSNKSLLETAYVAAEHPWQQSGVGLGGDRNYEYWEAIRRPIADCIDRPGTFLDIGCANGYLLECLLKWVGERQLEIVPYGLDHSEKLVALAQRRLPRYASHIFVDNAWDWVPPRRFDFVRTELVYVPDHLHNAYITRLLDLLVEPGGYLLVAAYRGRDDPTPELPLGSYLANLGFTPDAYRLGFHEGVERTRVALLVKPS